MSYIDQERDLFRKYETPAASNNVSRKIENRHGNASVFYSWNTASFYIIIRFFYYHEVTLSCHFARKTL